MARIETDWVRLHNAFEPTVVLADERSRELYCEREHSPFELMCVDFAPSLHPTRPPIAFFTGHRGSGKSSMLWRLLEHFHGEYFLVYFDVEHNLDRNTANQIDLLYLLGATIFQVAVQEGIDVDPAHLRLLADSVQTLTSTKKETGRNESVDVVKLASGLLCFGAGALGGGIAEKLAEAALKPFAFTAGVSEEVVRKREIEPQVQQIINNVNLIIADVQTKAGQPLLVVVDGLDKIRRTEQAQLIFVASRALLGPICRIIYTVPMLVYSSLEFAQAEQEGRSYLLPNVKLYQRTSGRKYTPGYETMHEVVAKRLHALGLEPTDVFAPGVLDLVIKKSGGVMRWLIGMVQDACSFAQIRGQDRVSRAAANQAIDRWATRFGMRLTTARLEELRKIHASKLPSGDADVSELLQSLLIVAYRNRRTWFDVHPLLWEELEE